MVAPPVAAASPDGVAASKPLPADGRLITPFKITRRWQHEHSESFHYATRSNHGRSDGERFKGTKEDIANSLTTKPMRLMALNQGLKEASVDSTERLTQIDWLVSFTHKSTIASVAESRRHHTLGSLYSFACLFSGLRVKLQSKDRCGLPSSLCLLDGIDINGSRFTRYFLWFPSRAALFTGDYSSKLNTDLRSKHSAHSCTGELESPSLLSSGRSLKILKTHRSKKYAAFGPQ